MEVKRSLPPGGSCRKVKKERKYAMISWKNLDLLPAYGKLNALKNRVDLQTAMAGENGATRVK